MTRRTAAALVALALLIAGCSTDVGFGGQVDGTRWVLDSYADPAGQTLLPDTLYADAKFGAGRVNGFSGCNDFSAIYRTGARSMHVSQSASTQMACDEATMTFEQRYLALLDSSRYYGTRPGALHVYDANRNLILQFHAAPRNPLLGKWKVENYRNGGTVVEPLKDTSLEVVFRIATTGGYGGCNSFSAAYGTNGEILRVGRVATTREVCATEVMEQEAAFLDALETVARVDPRGSRLTLTDRDGQLLLALVRPNVAEAEAAAAASPTARPVPSGTQVPRESVAAPTPIPTPKPTATPTPKPTAKPTAKPTPAPTAAPAEPTADAPGKSESAPGQTNPAEPPAPQHP